MSKLAPEGFDPTYGLHHRVGFTLEWDTARDIWLMTGYHCEGDLVRSTHSCLSDDVTKDEMREVQHTMFKCLMNDTGEAWQQ